MKKKLVLLTVFSLAMMTGCSMPNIGLKKKGAASTASQAESNVPTASEATIPIAEGDTSNVRTSLSVSEEPESEIESYPTDLFSRIDALEPTPTPTEEPTPTPTETPTPTPTPTETPTPTPELDPQAEAIRKLSEVRTTDDLIKALHDPHDNEQYGAVEHMASYVGQISLTNVAYCVSNVHGIEEDDVMLKRLEVPMIRRDFIYVPDRIQEAHEYYDKNGNLLFTIEDLDFTGGQSTGKFRIRTPGSSEPLDFYSDEVNILMLEEYDRWAEAKKEEIGDRTIGLSEAEKQANIKKNHERYGETVDVTDFITEDKLNAISTIHIYHPDCAFADAEGYVTIPFNCAYVQKLLTTKYIRKSHVYKLNNIKHYVIFRDASGNDLFTFNDSGKTAGVDLYRRDKTMKKGYKWGRIIYFYPETVDIEKELEYERTLLLEEDSKLRNEEIVVMDEAPAE